MSQQYDNTDKGVLFKNREKRTEKSPDYSGSLNVDGTEFFLDAWIREGKNGKFMSVSVKRKDKQPTAVPAQRPAPNAYAQAKGGQRPRDEAYRAGSPHDDDGEPPF